MDPLHAALLYFTIKIFGQADCFARACGVSAVRGASLVKLGSRCSACRSAHCRGGLQLCSLPCYGKQGFAHGPGGLTLLLAMCIPHCWSVLPCTSRDVGPVWGQGVGEC